MKGIFAVIGMTAMLFSSASLARGEMHPDSFIALYVGQAEMEVMSGGATTGSIEGDDAGIAVRVLAPGAMKNGSGLVADFDYNSVSVSRNGVDIEVDRMDVSLGYMGIIGQESSWFAQVAYTAPKIELISVGLCGGSCGSSSKSGFGIRGGFIWPFAGNWVGKLSLASIRIGAKDGDNAYNQGSAEAAIGYKFASSFGVNLGVRSDVYQDAVVDSDEFSISSTRLIAAYSF